VRAALLSGLGPHSKSSQYLDGSLFDSTPDDHTTAILDRAGLTGFSLNDLAVQNGSSDGRLLRPLTEEPAHLTTFTLQSILESTTHEYVHVPMAHVWNGQAPDIRDVDVVLLSTTYIWNPRMLRQAVDWVSEYLPGTPIVAGGQYTNLKYAVALAEHEEIIAVVRGDGELALPLLLDRLQKRGGFEEVPNLVWRDGDRVRINKLEYIDLDTYPSPSFPGPLRIAPYESMRGCPFDCAFCGFPLATPQWRYKSAQKIRDDWVGYAERNGAAIIEAMDSTFTVPPTRLRELFEILPGAGVPWECYSRANVINSEEFLDKLLAAHCFRLVIGFESMNDTVLRLMSKRVNATQNRRALNLLRRSDMDYSICFIIGYPGETPEYFQDTGRFLVDEFVGRYQLHLFGTSDETMPLWNDRETLRIEVDDPHDSDSAWSHIGMNSDDARRLRTATLDETRRRNDKAVFLYWQGRFQEPLVPSASADANLAIEKAIERIGMVGRDFPDDHDRGAAQVKRQLETLGQYGCQPVPARKGPDRK
jgi:hypothetical protein